MKLPTKKVRELRRAETLAEEIAWGLLRNRRLGLKFRRQYPIGDYVVDFYCFELRLALELDGGAHSQPSQMRKDRIKDAYLKSLGICVVRIPNGLVMEHPEGFAGKIRECALRIRA